MGDDGHVASLFPNHSYSKDEIVVIEGCSPKSPKQRISMSYERLSASNNIFKIIIGESTQEAVQLVLRNNSLPFNKVFGDSEKIFIHNSAILT